MRRQDFSFNLPEELIANYPPQQRTDCRLLHLDGRDGRTAHLQFTDLAELLRNGDLLVFNNTRVIPARLFGRKASGGHVEILVERVQADGRLLVQLRSSKKLRPDAVINVLARDSDTEVAKLQVLGREQSFYLLAAPTDLSLDALFERAGHMPLPPYIKRDDELLDAERYQTVYARHSGAVAAPTAGLHFDDAFIEKLKDQGVDCCEVTLHIGAATFQPVRVDKLEDHTMHAEHVQVDADCIEKIAATRARGGRVVAIGSTSVRALETAAASGRLTECNSDSRLFIYPGYRFQVVDAMVTNFHLSESSLLMMVCAFAGTEHVLAAYEEAVARRYQFFSYGDAMFIEATAGVNQS